MSSLTNKERRKMAALDRHIEILHRTIANPTSAQQQSFDRELLGALKWATQYIRTHNGHHRDPDHHSPEPRRPRDRRSDPYREPEVRVRW